MYILFLYFCLYLIKFLLHLFKIFIFILVFIMWCTFGFLVQEIMMSEFSLELDYDSFSLGGVLKNTFLLPCTVQVSFSSVFCSQFKYLWPVIVSQSQVDGWKREVEFQLFWHFTVDARIKHYHSSTFYFFHCWYRNFVTISFLLCFVQVFI